MFNSNGLRVTTPHLMHALGFAPMLCWVSSNNRSIGTGFLVGPDLIITNYHVYQAIEEYGHINCRVFFYENDLSNLDPIRFHEDESEWVWIARPPKADELDNFAESDISELPAEQHLDYVILRLNREAGFDLVKIFDDNIHPPVIQVRGWVRLFDSPNDIDSVFKKEDIVLVHHPAPATEPEYSSAKVEDISKDGTRIFYKFSNNMGTDGGSSGALCIGIRSSKLVALHQAHHGEFLNGEEMKRGIPIKKIVRDLEKSLSEEKKKRLRQERDMSRWMENITPLGNAFSNYLGNVIKSSNGLLTREYLVLAYLGCLPEHNPPRRAFDLIVAIQDLLMFPASLESFPMLDFVMFIMSKNLPELKTGLEHCIDQLAVLNPHIDIRKAIAASNLRVLKRIQENKFVRLQIDIRSDINNVNNSSDRLFNAQISIFIMGKHMQISDNFEFENIKSRQDFVGRLERFWYSKADNYLRELGPSVVEIAFRLTNEALDWDVDRQKLYALNYLGSYYIVIGDKYPVWYSSIDRQDRFNDARRDLKKAWSTVDKRGKVIKINRRDLHRDVFSKKLEQIPHLGNTICVFSVVSLEQVHKLRIYDYIMMNGVPAFIWRRDNVERLPKRVSDSLSKITSISDLRDHISSADGNPLEHSKYVAFLFDDPDSLTM